MFIKGGLNKSKKIKVEKVNKIEAARRQLVEAITLFFERRDPIAIHTLIGASHQILYDLAKGKGDTSIFKDSPYYSSRT